MEFQRRGRRGYAEDTQEECVVDHGRRWFALIATFFLCVSSAYPLRASAVDSPKYPSAPAAQTVAEADAKSAGCMSCHTATDRHTMHQNPGVVLGCTDCHGGDARVVKPDGARREDGAYLASLRFAHVLPRDERAWHWPSSATPARTYTLLNREDPAFVRFINP